MLGALTLLPLLIGLFAKRLIAAGIIATVQVASPLLNLSWLENSEGMFDFTAFSVVYSLFPLSLLAMLIVVVDRRRPFEPTLL